MCYDKGFFLGEHMKFCFVLPKSDHRIVGGYKIVYEFANRLIDHQQDVTILFLNSRYLKKYHLPRFIRKMIMNLIMHIEPKWFDLKREVKKTSDYQQYRKYSFDVVVATAVSTARFVKDSFPSAKKAYLIQGFENWVYPEKELFETYNYGFINIVVSNWLKTIVDTHSKSVSILLSNPIDTKIYKCITPLQNRERYSIGLLYSPLECKGFSYALQVIKELKKDYPELCVTAFGSYNRPKELPLWVNYYEKASQSKTVEIYNSVRVFICASIDEGFGLTSYEALACGCVLVTTDFQGAREYAIDNYNSLISCKYDTDAMIQNIKRAFNDDLLASELSANGIKTVSKASWDETIQKFVDLF